LLYAIGVAGTQYSNILYETTTSEEYQAELNATRYLNETSPEALAAYTFAGHIYNGLIAVWNKIGWIIAGFPYLLYQIRFTLPQDGRAAYDAVTGVILTAQSLIVILWTYELLTGRRVED